MPAPYEHLGLFWNPFGCAPARQWSALCVTALDLDALAERLRAPGFAVVFRGHAGRGKSTHLRALNARFAALPYTYLGPDASARTPIPRAPVHFVDEVQRLGPASRRRLFRRRASLALASHEDLRPALEARGYVVQDVEIAGLDRPRLEQIVARRVRWAARPAREGVAIARARLDALLAEHGDDLRTIQDALYDDIESLRRTHPIEPTHDPRQV